MAALHASGGLGAQSGSSLPVQTPPPPARHNGKGYAYAGRPMAGGQMMEGLGGSSGNLLAAGGAPTYGGGGGSGTAPNQQQQQQQQQQQATLLLQYEEAKANLLHWERSFQAATGRHAEPHDRRASPRYQERLRRFKELRKIRHAAAAEAEAAAAASSSSGGGAAASSSGPPAPGSPAASNEVRRDMAREYKRLKRRLKDWENEFEVQWRRAPTAEDREMAKPIADLYKRAQSVKAKLVVTIKVRPI